MHVTFLFFFVQYINKARHLYNFKSLACDWIMFAD